MNVALFGFGTVGCSTAYYLYKKKNILKSRTSCDIVLTHIYTRTPQKILKAGLPKKVICNDWEEIINNKNIDCIIELMGDDQFSYKIISNALKNKKHVVTANKALLARRGSQLWDLAQKHGVSLAVEASCGAGIPVIRAITDGLIANTISAIYGVLNGTCNFILTEMEKKQISFKDALRNAQKIGLAESNPSLDIDGFDTGHKIAIMSTFSFNTKISMNTIPIRGISDIKNIDILYGKMLGYTIKLIAAAIQLNKTSISIWVHPVFIDKHNPIAKIEGPFNAISIVGNEIGPTMYYGRGAGGDATSSAIIADIVSISNGSNAAIYNTIKMRTDKNNHLLQQNMGGFITPAYIRFTVQDKPGILAKITHIFAFYSISIARILQEDYPHTPLSTKESSLQTSGNVELIIITHTHKWKIITEACNKISRISSIQHSFTLYPILTIPTGQ